MNNLTPAHENGYQCLPQNWLLHQNQSSVAWQYDVQGDLASLDNRHISPANDLSIRVSQIKMVNDYILKNAIFHTDSLQPYCFILKLTAFDGLDAQWELENSSMWYKRN